MVTAFKLTKSTLSKNELRDLEAKSNEISNNQLNKLSNPGSSNGTEFTEKVFVYAKYVVLKQMASDSKHDIAI